jgi:hypothetical protein
MMPSKFRNRQPPWPQYPHSLLGNLVPSPRRSVPSVVCYHLAGTFVWNAVGYFYILPLVVLELGI